MNIKEFLKREYVLYFLVISNLFSYYLYFSKPETKTIVIEESQFGFIPRTISKTKYDKDAELESFLRLFLFKRYNFTSGNVKEQLESSFKLSSKRVQERIEKSIEDKKILQTIFKDKISQIFTPSEFKYGRSKNAIEAIVIGERMITHGSEIDLRENVKLSFLIKLKDRDEVNPYMFYVDGIMEEVVE